MLKSQCIPPPQPVVHTRQHVHLEDVVVCSRAIVHTLQLRTYLVVNCPYLFPSVLKNSSIFKECTIGQTHMYVHLV